MAKAERRPEDDPRFQRVREQLVRAVVDLAAEKPAEQISVSELTARAGVARTTFYKHAESPAGLLANHLINQIRPKIEPLATLLDDAHEDYLLRWRHIMIDLLEHAREHAPVYERVFTVDGQSVVLAIMSAYFEKVFGGDSFERKKPDPLPLLKTCEALGTDPARTLMVGDSSNDAQAARAAGCPVVLVTYGYNHGQPVRAVDADGYVDSLAQLT